MNSAGEQHTRPMHSVHAAVSKLWPAVRQGAVVSPTPGPGRWSGYRLGHGTWEVWRDLLKLSDSDIDPLEAEAVIFCDPKGSQR